MWWKKAFVYFILMFCRFFFLSLCVSQLLVFFFFIRFDDMLMHYVKICLFLLCLRVFLENIRQLIWSHHMQSKYFMNYVEKWKVFFSFWSNKKQRANSHWNRHFKRPIHGWNVIAYVQNSKKLIFFSSGNRNRINISVKTK